MSALTWMSSAWMSTEEAPVDESSQADGGSPFSGDLVPAGEPIETDSTSRSLRQDVKGHSAARARPASSHNPARDTFSQELDRGIRKFAERRYEIKRSTLELALGNFGLLARWVQVRPEAREGKPFGFRLFAIKADGPFAKLGLRNDDILVSINGLNIATPERVLDAYSKLKEASRLGLGLVRGGHEITQEYTIR